MDDVEVPEPRDVEPALDRRGELGLVGGAAADEHEVRRVRAPRGAARRERVAGRPRAAAGARRRAGVVHDAVRDPVLDERQGRLGHALEVEGAGEGAGEPRAVGQVDGRGGDRVPSRPARAPRPSAWARPLKAIKPSSSRSPPTASGPRTTGSSPGATATGSARATLATARRATSPGSTSPGGDGEPGAPARAPVRRPGDDLHPRVGHRVAQPRAPAGRDRRLDVPGGPDAERLEAVLGAGGEGRAQGRARPSPRRAPRS